MNKRKRRRKRKRLRNVSITDMRITPRDTDANDRVVLRKRSPASMRDRLEKIDAALSELETMPGPQFALQFADPQAAARAVQCLRRRWLRKTRDNGLME